MPEQLRIGSLCSGYGGLDMAVTDVLDARTAWHCQYDPDDRHQYAARILKHHWPDVPNHGDITAVDWIEVEPINILTAGFPCQDLSYAGRGAGIKEGTRSGLWYSVADAVRALRPRLVVLENVRAIVGRRPGLDVVIGSLTDLGYDAEWACVRASDVGAPHERWRWFLLAWPADAAGARLEGAWSRRRSAERGGTAADADDQREHGRGRPSGKPQRHATSPDRDAAHSDGDAPSHDRELSARRDAVQQRVRDDATGRGPATSNAQGDGRNERWTESEGVVGGSDAAVGSPADPALDWRQYGPAVHRWEHVLGRAAPSPVDDRGRLGPQFVEWMMGLPEGHVCDVPAPDGMTPAGLRNARLKALGNGVVRQQAAYALRILLGRMSQEAAA